MATTGTVKTTSQVYVKQGTSLSPYETTISAGTEVTITGTGTCPEGPCYEIEYTWGGNTTRYTAKDDGSVYTRVGNTIGAPIGSYYAGQVFSECTEIPMPLIFHNKEFLMNEVTYAFESAYEVKTYSGVTERSKIAKKSIEGKSGTRAYILKQNVQIVSKEEVNEQAVVRSTGGASSSVTIYAAPSTSSEVVSKVDGNTNLAILEVTGNGFYKVRVGAGAYATTGYMVAGQVEVDDTLTEVAISKSDIVFESSYGYSSSEDSSTTEVVDDSVEQEAYVPKGFTSTNPDWMQVAAEYAEIEAEYYARAWDDAYYQNLSRKYFNCLGYPPKYNMDIDIQYTDQDNTQGVDIAPGIGRVFGKTILSNPPILSICPGKVKMFPNLMGVERENLMEALSAAAAGNDSLVAKILSDDSSKFSGKLYSFEADVATYATYVNALCRACAILMGVGDELVPNTSSKLKEFDYAYWSIRSKVNQASANSADSDGSIFKNFFPSLVNKAHRLYDSLVENTVYMNFFLNGSETSVNETIDTNIENSPLDSVMGGINGLSSTINYFTGSGFNVGTDEASVTEALKAALNTGNESLDGLIDVGKNLLRGGKIVLPKMVSQSSYTKTASFSTKFMSPYGDPYSIFLKCVVPTCHLLALALPRQLSDNMYTYPFIVRANQMGSVHIDAGVLTGINVVRGGDDNTSLSKDGIATEWEVQFQITPLVDELMMTSTNTPVLFCKNENLIDYLGNMCGMDLLANNYSTRWELTLAFIRNRWAGIIPGIQHRIYDQLFNRLSKFAKISWGS